MEDEFDAGAYRKCAVCGKAHHKDETTLRWGKDRSDHDHICPKCAPGLDHGYRKRARKVVPHIVVIDHPAITEKPVCGWEFYLPEGRVVLEGYYDE